MTLARLSTPRRTRGLSALLLFLLTSASAVAVHAQQRPVSVTGRVGIVGASDDYQSNCGHSSLAVGLDVRGAGRVFPVANLEHFIGSGGGDEACLLSTDPTTRVTGGLRLERTTRFQVGAGSFVGDRRVRLEGTVRGGVAYGRPGVALEGLSLRTAEGAARLLPQVGGDLSLVLLRHVVVSMAFDWTRLPTETAPLAGGDARTTHSWSRMTSVQAGIRVGGVR